MKIALALLVLGFTARAADAAPPIFDMEAIRDASTLDVEVIDDWHRVDGKVPTRQKIISIKVGDIWPGQEYRMPVRFIVPADRKANGFHLTGGNNPGRIRKDAPVFAFDAELLGGGIGLVQTVVQVLKQSGLGELGKESEERFLKTLNPHDKIQYWAWPATMMRALTAAHAETGHFVPGKVALSGGSKNGATPSMAILHDRRMTAVHASVSPIWDSPLRLADRKAWDELEAAAGEFKHPFLGGHYGPIYNRRALEAGRSWEDLEKFARDISDSVFITRNIEDLRARGVDMLFHPGTHDFVCFDLAWGGAHHPDIPVYLGANTGHGKKGHPKLERGQQNRNAFLLRHFFPGDVEPLLEPPGIESRITGNKLEIAVRFKPGSGEESGRIWWMHDRAPDGSPAYLGEPIPDENWADMIFDENRKTWTAEIVLEEGASRIDVFTNHRKTITYNHKPYPTYISSPYTRIPLNPED